MAHVLRSWRASTNMTIPLTDTFLVFPALSIARDEGTADAYLISDGLAKSLYAHIRTSIDPAVVKPFLAEKTQRVFDYFTLTEAPHAEFEIWTREGETNSVGVSGKASLTNFTFRAESIQSAQSSVRFINQVIECFEPTVVRTDGVARAEYVRIDLARDTVFLTNGFSTTDPMVVANAIGTNTAKAIAHYHFLHPPEAKVNGTAPLHGSKGFDLHFNVSGGPFHWLNFEFPNVSGDVHYVGDTVELSRIRGDFYSGKMKNSRYLQ